MSINVDVIEEVLREVDRIRAAHGLPSNAESRCDRNKREIRLSHKSHRINRPYGTCGNAVQNRDGKTAHDEVL